MRKISLFISAIALSAITLNAQTVATFEALTLPTVDTYYVNYTASGADVGFNNGLAHFPCVYDSTGGWWSWRGFVYTDKTDSVTSGYTNQYSAKTAIGYGGSAKYAVAYCYEPTTIFANFIKVDLLGAAIGKPVSGCYITNSTYAYNSMKYGLDFPGKKFGGTTGNDPDWFKLVITGTLNDTLKPDSVVFYLADYRFAHNDSDYIVNTWQWVNLLPLGHVDSLIFTLSSTDNGIYGMNTPAYFCIDNFTTNETSVAVSNQPIQPMAKIYPNPTTNKLFVQLVDNGFEQIVLLDMAGNLVFQKNITQLLTEINTVDFAPGIYLLQLSGNGKQVGIKIEIKH